MQYAQVLGMSADRATDYQRENDVIIANALWKLAYAAVDELGNL